MPKFQLLFGNCWKTVVPLQHVSTHKKEFQIYKIILTNLIVLKNKPMTNKKWKRIKTLVLIRQTICNYSEFIFRENIWWVGPILRVTSPALGSDDLNLDQSATSIQILLEPALVTWHVFFHKITTLLFLGQSTAQ